MGTEAHRLNEMVKEASDPVSKRTIASHCVEVSPRPEAAVTSAFVLKTNIAHYEAALKLSMDAKKRAAIEKLRAEAVRDLALAEAESRDTASR